MNYRIFARFFRCLVYIYPENPKIFWNSVYYLFNILGFGPVWSHMPPPQTLHPGPFSLLIFSGRHRSTSMWALMSISIIMNEHRVQTPQWLPACITGIYDSMYQAILIFVIIS
jgi:uncharacterized protein with PQ loop repeat